MVVIAAIALGTGGIAAWRLIPSDTVIERERTRQMRVVAEVKNVLRPLRDARPLRSGESATADLARALDGAVTIAPGVPDAARIAAHALIDAATAFVAHRIGSDDPDAYVAWRLAEGYRWQNDAYIQASGIADTYSLRLGTPWPGRPSLPRAFAEMWRYARAAGGLGNVPHAVFVDPGSCGVIIQSARRGERLDPPDFGALSPVSASLRGGYSSSEQWLVPPVTLTEMLGSRPVVALGHVGFVIECTDGSRQLIRLTYVFDEEAGRWWLTTLCRRGGSLESTMGIDF
jgi:hypothetical protein